MTPQPTDRVWRYMSFAKLVWMLQKKRLWFSRADLLDDKWEVMIDTPQLNSIITSRPPSISAEQVIEQTGSEVKARREQTFINCWTSSEHENHALWRIYCPSPESVAIQTTLDRLKNSIGLPVLKVSYGPHEANGTLPDTLKLVTQKRPMFAYEQETRIVYVKDFSDGEHPERKTIGVEVGWDPEYTSRTSGPILKHSFGSPRLLKKLFADWHQNFVIGSGIPK
jgi:hypothetical protein